MRSTLKWGLVLAAAAALAAASARDAHGAFEDIEVSPRVRALGSSWAALRADDYAVFHNPAALAWAGRPAGAASYLRPFGYDFSSQSTFAGSITLPRGAGGLGFGVRHFGVNYLGQSLTSETTVSLAQGFHLLRDQQSELAVGWALSMYALDYGLSTEVDVGSGVTRIDPGSATSVGVNVGAVATVRDRTRVGFHVLNLNNPNIGKRDKEELHRRVSVGVSYAPYPGVETVLDIANELGQQMQYRGGAEFQVTDFLWLRTGIHTEPSIFTAGFGLRRAGMSIEYSFSTGGGVLGDTHHIGIGYALPEVK